MVQRHIRFDEPSAFDSLGRNGRIRTFGIYVKDMDSGRGADVEQVLCMSPERMNGAAGNCELTIAGSGLGELTAVAAEAFVRKASPEARQALLARITQILEHGIDPVRAAEEEDRRVAEAIARNDLDAALGRGPGPR